MVTRSQIQLRKHPRSMKLIEKFAHGGNREAVLNGNLIKRLIIDTKLPCVVFLPNQ